MTDAGSTSTVSIVLGSIHVPVETCEKYFRSVEAVALLPHEDGILLLPLIQGSAGGSLLKVRNLRGDRVVHAQEFFRNNGYVEDQEETTHKVRWLSERAGLLIQNVRRQPFDQV